MDCICKYCGHKTHSSNLVFDMGALVKEAGDEMPLEHKKMYQTICNVIGDMSEGPSLISEEELLDKATVLPEESDTLFSRVYVAKKDFVDRVKYALIQLEGFPIEAGVTADQIKTYADRQSRRVRRMTVRTPLIQLCEKLRDQDTAAAFAELLNDRLSIPDEVLDLCFKLIRGEGDIKVGEVQTMAHTVLSKTRLCPFCGAQMSGYAGAYPEIVLTMLGSPRVSKSTTLTACADQFLNGSPRHRLPISWECCEDDQDWKEFEKRCLERYRNNQEVEPTQVNSDAVLPRFSVIVTIGEEKYLLTIVDLPGELMGEDGINEELIRKYSDLYQNVDGVWYCSDCAEIRQITSQNALAQLGYEDQKLPVSLSRIRQNMRELSHIFNGRDIPVAFIIGKSDVLAEESEGKERYALYHSQPEGMGPYYTKNGTELVIKGKELFIYMEGIQRIVQTCANSLDQALRSSFPSHAYIAVSGYGHPPNSIGQEKNAVNPYNAEMPFMWMMAALGHIRVQEISEKRGRTNINHYRATEDKITHQNLCLCGPGQRPAYRRH